MRFDSRRLVLAAAVALPLAVAVASFAFTDDVAPPNVPPSVQVGELLDPTDPTNAADPSPSPSVEPTRERPRGTPSKRPQATAEVVPPPPVRGGDDDADDDDDGDDDDD